MSTTDKPDIKAAFFDIDGTLIPFGPKSERTVPNDTVSDEFFVTGTPEKLEEVEDRWIMTPHKAIEEIDTDRPIYQFVLNAAPEEDERIERESVGQEGDVS